MTKKNRRSPAQNSLDVLDNEDHAIRQGIALLKQHRGTSVEDRYEYGRLVKSLTRQIAVRQSSLMDVGFSIHEMPDLRLVSDRMLDRAIARREQIDKVGKMSRGVQGINLNTGQDFVGEFAPLLDEIGEEIEWELAEAIPLIRRSQATAPGRNPFRSARYVKRHARMKLSPSGRRWREYAPFISRFLTMLDRFQDHPRASAHDVPPSSTRCDR